MADVYSMMHCHFMSTCGTLCLCTLCVLSCFSFFPFSVPSPLPACALYALSDILSLPTSLCVLGGCGCACVDMHACVWINYVCMCPQLVWLTRVEWGSCIVMVAYTRDALCMPTVVIHAVFLTTEADHDLAAEELGEDQWWWRCDPISVCQWSTSDCS